MNRYVLGRDIGLGGPGGGGGAGGGVGGWLYFIRDSVVLWYTVANTDEMVLSSVSKRCSIDIYHNINHIWLVKFIE